MTPVAGRRVAVLPARGGSKRLARKNIVELAGRPALAHVVSSAQTSGLFERVVVSTDDREIADVARTAGSEVIGRPADLGSDTASVAEVCVHALRQDGAANGLAEAFCCLYPTAVFVTPEDLRAAFALLDSSPPADVVMGVSEYPIHPYKALGEHEGYLVPQFPREAAMKSQFYPTFVASNGTLYWGRTEGFLAHPTFYPMRLKGHVLPRRRAVDIDTPEDLAWARQLAELTE
jgi:N-acylneuraminate cytidylyltransferase